MPKAVRLLTNWSKGELSPLIEGRPDLSAYYEGGKEILNYLLLRQGGLVRRPGTRFVAEVKDSTKDTILIPFEFSVDDTFQLEFGHLYIRFYKNGVRIEVLGVPVEVISPYTDAQLRNIHFTQSADVLFLFHRSHAQRKLSRVSDTSWVLSTILYLPPPSFEADVNLNDVLAYNGVTGTVVEFLTTNMGFLNADVGRLIIAGAGRAIIKNFISARQVQADVFDNFDATRITVGPGVLSSVGIAVTTTADHGLAVGDHVIIASGAQVGQMNRVVTIPTLTTATLDIAFSMDQNGVDWKKMVPVPIGEWALRNSPQTTLDPDKREPVGTQVTLVAGIAAFRSTDVGKFIFIYGGLVKITVFDSSVQVKGELLSVLSGTTVADPPAAPAGSWTLEETSWSIARGFPRTGEFFQGRLAQASTVAQPTTWWLSVSDDFENYAVGSRADDALDYTIASRRVNRIEWLADSVDLFFGTAGAELRAVGDRQGEPLGGDKIPLMERLSTQGCAAIQPGILSKRIIFVDRSHRKVLTISFSFEEDSFVPLEVTAVAEHITESTIRLGPIGVRQRLDPQIFFVRTDGVLIVLTFFPNEKVVGFTRIVTDGTFEAVSVIPQLAGKSDQVWVIVKRTINGVTKRYVEYFDADAAEFVARAWTSLQTDCVKVYDGAAATVMTGLSHLEAKTVDVVADGSFKGTKIVSGGQLTLDDAASKVEIGLHYNSKAVTMRPAIEGAIIEGLPRSWDKVFVRLDKTIGGHLNGERLQYQPSDLDVLGLFTGDRDVTGQGWDTVGRITVEQRDPYPMSVLAVFGTLSVGDHA